MRSVAAMSSGRINLDWLNASTSHLPDVQHPASRLELDSPHSPHGNREDVSLQDGLLVPGIASILLQKGTTARDWLCHFISRVYCIVGLDKANCCMIVKDHR